MSEKIRDSFIFYRSFYQSAKKLSKEDKAEIFDAICSYALDGDVIELSVIPEAIFTVIKPNLDANRRRWENGCKDKKKSSGDEAEGKQEVSKLEAKDKQTVSRSEGNKDKDVNKDEESKSESKSKSFIIPTLQEIKAYCQERKNSINPDSFLNYYQAKGWMIGKNKMKDWKAAIRTWEGNDKQQPQKSSFNKDNWKHLA